MSFKQIVVLRMSSFIKRGNSVFNRITSYLAKFGSDVSQNKTQSVFLIAIAFGVFLRFYNLSYFHFMTADECVYTQAVYAITKGYVPYRDVFIAHPPMHFLIEYPFMLINVSLPMVRFVSILLSLGTILTLFFATRALFSSKVAKIATILFALAPYAILFNKLAIVENTLLFFTTLTIFLFFKYYKDSDRKYLLLSGFFAGIAAISKYTMLFLVVVLMAFVIFRKEFKNLVFFTACAGIAPSILLLMLLLSGIYHNFYIQTVGLQLIRFSLPLSWKVWESALYVAWVAPLLILAIVTMVRKKKKEDMLLIFLYVVPFLIMLSGRTFFAHYPLMLTPVLSILAARSLESFSLPKRVTMKEAYATLMMAIFLIHFLIFGFLFLIPSMEFDVRKKMEAAAYIRGITNETDKIWTTEADIAFFAGRMIVTPHSEVWKFQGFYEDLWGYFGKTYIGQYIDYPNGLVTLNEIQQTLEEEKPKIVLILKKFKITDYFVWNGIENLNSNQTGLANYILTHYYPNCTLYDIEIYVRKQTQ